MKLLPEMLAAMRAYFDRIPFVTFNRGRSYFALGYVSGLECVEADSLYTAVVHGGQEYDVGLEFTGGQWTAECSCPVGFDCKHIVASLLALQNRASEREESAGERKGAARANPRRPALRQPPRSVLYDKLVARLGRGLRRDEADFVRKVQAAFDQARRGPLTEADLSGFTTRGPVARIHDYWTPLQLWPDLPSDDFYFWQFIARELRRRDWKAPAFMDEISDPGLVEEAIRTWEREREIQRWKEWFGEFEPAAPVSEPGILELRLAVLGDEARLQWRNDPGIDFADLKPAEARKFGEQFERGTLTLTNDSLPLWSAAFKPWARENWWSFKYANAASRPALNRLLRMPLASDRVVFPEGAPFPRFAEPLRLSLRGRNGPPTDANATPQMLGNGAANPAVPAKGAQPADDYELHLATADGGPPLQILCVLSGNPTLYLTVGGLFSGPPAHLIESGAPKVIPAAAIETSDGLRFLHAAGVPIPEHLAQRVRTVAVTVTISCELEPTYPRATTEEILINVSAAAPEMKTEHFREGSWQANPRRLLSGIHETEARRPKTGAAVVIHERAAQRHFPRALQSLHGLKWDSYRCHWHLRLKKKTPELLVSWLKSLPPEIEVLLDKELATLRDGPVSGSVALDVSEAGIDWFDLKVALSVNDTTLTPEELKLLLNARGAFVRLGKKGWRRLQFNLTPEDDEQLARLGLDARDFSGEPQRLHALQLADDAAKRFLGPAHVEQIRRRAGELKARVAPPLPPAIRAEMRPYQTEGFHFLAYLAANRFGGVLADDMGLGKTLQTLAWLAWLRNNNGADASAAASGETACSKPGARPAASLVVCPKSVMDNWRAEAERFFPDLRVRLWRGEPASEIPGALKGADLIVLNYSQLRGLSPEISNAAWLAAILDEAQYIKNPDSQTANAARALKAEHRLALTGTPIENRLLDLWSIFSFAMPGALGNRAHFLRRFDAKDDPLARRRLAARVRPFLLRRTKAQVAKDLPDRVEEDLLCEMEGEQKLLYGAELKRARQIVLGLKTNKQLNAERFNILTSLLRLRQICCHPALVDGKLHAAESAKLAALEDLLEPLMAEDHKVLVFSQFVTMLELLRERVTARGWPHFYLSGETENRGDLVRNFQSADGGAVFLISLKAGGFGLNLTAASYVVLFDPWWNPAVENQAIDRTHRIGQTSKVMAYRLLMRDSVEGKIRDLQKQKAALAGDIFGEERFSQSLTLDDLKFLFAE